MPYSVLQKKIACLSPFSKNQRVNNINLLLLLQTGSLKNCLFSQGVSIFALHPLIIFFPPENIDLFI